MTVRELCQQVRSVLQKREEDIQRETEALHERMREIARENAALEKERKDRELRTLAHYIALEMKKGN